MKLLLGDCLDKLKELPDNSVDSVVTDAPYGLSAAKNSGKKSKGGFMGQLWDYDIPSVEVFRECLRVLKPGGHLLCFGGSRTYHRMAVNVEDAGFEIRDQIQWIYGSGFPKSHNIGKGVDKKLGNNREVVGENPNHRTSSALYELGFQDGKGDGQITKGNSEWEGWGTALKPAHEPIVMARKPLSEKTIVENVLKYGTGGINIDESRVGSESIKSPQHGKNVFNGDYPIEYNGEHKINEGRFPANIILSEEAAENLDQHTGISKSSKRAPKHNKKTEHTNTYTPKEAIYGDHNTYGDKGGASRYFYVVKPSKKEKDFGMMGDEKSTRKWRDNQGMKLTGSGNPRKETGKNNHPTVKPIKLMEYLIKLVTPKGGTTLDPFMGSGTTGIAALTNGFDFIGIEMSEEYMEIAEQRIDAWTKNIQTKLDI